MGRNIQGEKDSVGRKAQAWDLPMSPKKKGVGGKEKEGRMEHTKC